MKIVKMNIREFKKMRKSIPVEMFAYVLYRFKSDKSLKKVGFKLLFNDIEIEVIKGFRS